MPPTAPKKQSRAKQRAKAPSPDAKIVKHQEKRNELIQNTISKAQEKLQSADARFHEQMESHEKQVAEKMLNVKQQLCLRQKYASDAKLRQLQVLAESQKQLEQQVESD